MILLIRQVYPLPFSIKVCFINYAVHNRPLEVFWVSGKKRKKVADLEYGNKKTYCFTSYVGHQFEAVDKESNFYQNVTIKHITSTSFGKNPPTSQFPYDDIDVLDEKVKEVLSREWTKKQKVQRTFSSLGFAKGKLPDDVFASMGAFYYNNRFNAVSEEWGGKGKGIFVNWFESDVMFIQIPWKVKHHWQIRLLNLVSDWAGVEVEETAMYGLRQYQEGARLLSHVDRIKTHAVSLIVNVAQDNLANPWPVEVFDHGDRLHEVTMEAGDIVYYESAKNLHSRNRPLTCKKGGCRFINLFTHYRPVNDGENWHSNISDVPNRPQPLKNGQVAFDTDARTCRRRLENTIDKVNNTVGLGNVQCDDERLGQFISPTLFRLEEEDDMFRWWKSTENPNLIGFDENKKAIYNEVIYNEEVAADDNEEFDFHYKGDERFEDDELYDDKVHQEEEEEDWKSGASENYYCEFWAESGECERNPKFMQANCKKRCDKVAALAGAVESPTNDSSLRGRVDTGHPSCKVWAERGECEKNPGFMLKTCKNECDLVAPKSPNKNETDYEDGHPNCKKWAEKGECEKNPNYMKKKCKKRCEALDADDEL